MDRLFTLAHLSDAHLGPLPAFWPRHWNLKRAVGYVNWMRKRRFVHVRAIADLAVRDVRDAGVDHIAVTGDLANIGMPGEIEQGLDWLQSIGPADHVTVIPGNHDIYCPLWRDPGTERWAGFMSAFEDATGNEHLTGVTFPFVRGFGDIAIIAVNSAVPTAVGSAIGLVGDEQLERLAKLLRELGDQGKCRVVLIHHPPLRGQAKPNRALRDCDKLDDLLVQFGAELVLHGHNHRDMLSFRNWQGRSIPVVGVPSCSTSPQSHNPATYNIYRIHRDQPGFRIEMIQRRISPDGTRFEEASRQWLCPGEPAVHKKT